MQEGRGPVTQRERENEGAGARATPRRWPRKIYGAVRVPRTGCASRCCQRRKPQWPLRPLPGRPAAPRAIPAIINFCLIRVIVQT